VWEGADLAVQPSEFGAVHHRVRELRDPALFEDAGEYYLVYSIAGESGLAMARLEITSV
jgi:hypothetical protein